MELSLCDLHCDTVYEAHKRHQSLLENDLAISLANSKKYNRYLQVAALWTDYSLSDEEGWNAYLEMLDYLKNDPTIQNGNIRLIRNRHQLFPKVPGFILSVEDARILSGKLERLETLYQHGVRILTPCWKGVSCIGGSHDTTVGLTKFGRKVIETALELGILIDISHASYQTSMEIFDIAEPLHRPVIATHSNAYDVCPNPRNLKRDQIDRIRSGGGVIGLNLYPPFVKGSSTAQLFDLLSHIEYFLSQGMKNQLCLGCDMDGAQMPQEIQNVSHLPRLADLLLAKGYSKEFIDNLFYQNAYSFLSKEL